jgi:hypothetical protein
LQEVLKDFGLPSDISNYNLVYEHDGKIIKDFETIWRNLRFPANANFKIIKSAVPTMAVAGITLLSFHNI